MSNKIIPVSMTSVTNTMEFFVGALGFVVFSAGRWFGEMEVKTMVCHILRNFSLHSLDSRDKVLPIMNITLQSSARSHQVSTETR
ncbi:hypothetical protein CEXT_580121 [Caerostris extrusa]|uniref:Uncharacterized protein n=1 Tax=Caerostris extrusa TaxID=172846 RepID=A0AAV4M9I2_CAEEX|nr:hypothetical protein CEXT_580121 [Caerostris extrusa]